MRSLLLVTMTLALAAGCNRPTVKDRAATFPTSEDLGNGRFGNMLVGQAFIDADARETLEVWELEAGFGLAFNTEDPPSGGISMTRGLLEEVASGGIAADSGGASATWTDIPLGACDEAGFEQNEAGDCLVSVVLLVDVDRAVQYVADLELRGWAPDDWDGDPERFTIQTSLTIAEPEEE
jgi:hypothetical protein